MSSVPTILFGVGAPTPSTGGSPGDLYLDTHNLVVYGPFLSGSWGVGRSVVGPVGPAGPQGIQGESGASITGPAGPQGIQGEPGASPRYTGQYSEVTTYAPSDTVLFQGGVFQTATPTIGMAPDAAPAGILFQGLEDQVAMPAGWLPAQYEMGTWWSGSLSTAVVEGHRVIVSADGNRANTFSTGTVVDAVIDVTIGRHSNVVWLLFGTADGGYVRVHSGGYSVGMPTSVVSDWAIWPSIQFGDVWRITRSPTTLSMKLLRGETTVGVATVSLLTTTFTASAQLSLSATGSAGGPGPSVLGLTALGVGSTAPNPWTRVDAPYTGLPSASETVGPAVGPAVGTIATVGSATARSGVITITHDSVVVGSINVVSSHVRAHSVVIVSPQSSSGQAFRAVVSEVRDGGFTVNINAVFSLYDITKLHWLVI